MKKSAVTSAMSFATFALSVAIVYLAFQLVPQSRSDTLVPVAQNTLAEIHVGRVTGQTSLFTVDSVTIGAQKVTIPKNGHPGSLRVGKGKNICIRGWAIDSNRARAVQQVIAILGNDTTVAPMTIDRPDVVSALHLPPTENRSGFALNIPTDDLPKGLYHLRLLVVGADAKSLLNTNFAVDVDIAMTQTRTVDATLDVG